MHYSRRKFIATAASGVAATAVTPMALAAKQPGAYHASSTMESNTRVAPSEFIIFPWGSMPIAPSNGPWGDLTDTNDMLKDLFDCGFNTSGFTRNIEILRDIRNNQLVGILRVGINTNLEVTQEEADNTIRKVMESITDPEDRKAVHAIYIRDEPNASLFPRLAIWSKAIKKQGVLPYINLYPDAVLPEGLGTKDYEEHLDQYVEICDPPYISYDNYSLFEGGRLDEDRFYGNIESIRHKSLQAGIPFWNVILANAHFKYAEPSDATFAIQVYSTLAYGGRGIGYFTYYTPQVGNYRLASIDRFGYRTKTWGMMRNINLQVHALAPVYCQLKSVNVFHTGHIVRNGRSIETAKLVESISNGSLVVGEFTHPDGKPYAMIVNKDVHSSIEFDIEFKEKGEIMIVSQFNQGRVPFQGEQKWLAPGCGVLLTVE
ncbi:MAG: hypothetical protein BWZ00_00055 [Bacteroidetes bacterium ADurb.BinA174]|nr:MAG: hypothetical protein BWZ00_00055 [Bacteroidetes bacterium ADurb.BinA174]